MKVLVMCHGKYVSEIVILLESQVFHAIDSSRITISDTYFNIYTALYSIKFAY